MGDGGRMSVPHPAFPYSMNLLRISSGTRGDQIAYGLARDQQHM